MPPPPALTATEIIEWPVALTVGAGGSVAERMAPKTRKNRRATLVGDASR